MIVRQAVCEKEHERMEQSCRAHATCTRCTRRLSLGVRALEHGCSRMMVLLRVYMLFPLAEGFSPPVCAVTGFKKIAHFVDYFPFLKLCSKHHAAIIRLLSKCMYL